MEGPKLWERYPEIWPTKASFFAWLRGSLRRAVWEKYPPKLKFKNENCSKPPSSYTGKGRSGAHCALTGKWECKSKLEVDHIEGNVSLKDWEDLLGFIIHLCGTEDDFQLVTRDAHKIKSYADRKGISFEEAILEKKVIAFSKKKADEQKRKLRSLGVGEEDLTSAAKRKVAMRKILQGGKYEANQGTETGKEGT